MGREAAQELLGLIGSFLLFLLGVAVVGGLILGGLVYMHGVGQQNERYENSFYAWQNKCIAEQGYAEGYVCRNYDNTVRAVWTDTLVKFRERGD